MKNYIENGWVQILTVENLPVSLNAELVHDDWDNTAKVYYIVENEGSTEHFTNHDVALEHFVVMVSAMQNANNSNSRSGDSKPKGEDN